MKKTSFDGDIPSVPEALTEKDKQDIKTAARLGADYVAVSFVRTAEDMHVARRLCREFDPVQIEPRSEAGGVERERVFAGCPYALGQPGYLPSEYVVYVQRHFAGRG